jgi:hypothetical protein
LNGSVAGPAASATKRHRRRIPLLSLVGGGVAAALLIGLAIWLIAGLFTNGGALGGLGLVRNDAEGPAIQLAPSEIAATPSAPQVVGRWSNAGMLGMSGSADLIEFSRDGAYRFFQPAMADEEEKTYSQGTYEVSGNNIIFSRTGDDDQPGDSYSQEFARKGRALLLRKPGSSTENYGDPFWEYCYPSGNEPPISPASCSGSELAKQLRDGLSYGLGKLSLEVRDFQTFNASGTYTSWTLELALQNRLGFDIDLGNTLIVAQISEEGMPVGVVRLRGPDRSPNGLAAPEQPNACYLLDDFDSTCGGRTVSIQGASFVMPADGDHPPHAGFGIVRAGSNYEFFEELRPNSWLKYSGVTGMVVVLPEFRITTPTGQDRWGAIISFRSSGGNDEKSEWVADNLELLPKNVSALKKQLTDPSTTLFRKVLFMNWLLQADAEAGSQGVLQAVENKSEGLLLATAMSCFTEYKLPQFAPRAVALEFDAAAASGIQKLASDYLDAIHHKREGIEIVKSPKAAEGHQDLYPTTWGAVRFVAPSSLVIRRVLIEKYASASNQHLQVWSDQGGKPGTKVAAFGGSGRDFRGNYELSQGDACWLVVLRDEEQGGFASGWMQCAADGVFTGSASTTDSGKTWSPGDAKNAFATEVWYSRK